MHGPDLQPRRARLRQPPGLDGREPDPLAEPLLEPFLRGFVGRGARGGRGGRGVGGGAGHFDGMLVLVRDFLLLMLAG